MPTMKPGWKTSEFWLHIGAALAICALSVFDPSKAGLPPLVQGAYGLIAPLALAWLAKNYGDSRAEVKTNDLKLQAAQAIAGIHPASVRPAIIMPPAPVNPPSP